MGVFHQADAGSDDIKRYRDLASNILIAGLGVVALVRVVAFVSDRPDDMDSTLADQIGGTAIGQHSAEVVGDAVVLNHGAVAITTTVQACTVTVRGDVVAEHACQRDAVGELAGWAEQHHLLVDGRRVPFLVGTGAQGDPRQPAGGEGSGFDLHARGPHLYRGDNAEADEVFEQAGEGG